jgi:hypothetical protein
MMRKTSNDIHTLLSENDGLQPLLKGLQRVNVLQQNFREALQTALPEPDGFARASRVSAVIGTTVVISAASAPVAAMLRQVVPRLLSGFQKQGIEVTAIHVVVQPGGWGAKAEPATRAPPPGETLSDAALARLADSLSDSPLKKTLEEIGKRRARKPKETLNKS